MAENILHRARTTLRNPVLEHTAETHNEALINIEDICLMVSGKALAQLGMTPPNRQMHDMFNFDLQRERSYDLVELNAFVAENAPRM